MKSGRGGLLGNMKLCDVPVHKEEEEEREEERERRVHQLLEYTFVATFN